MPDPARSDLPANAAAVRVAVVEDDPAMLERLCQVVAGDARLLLAARLSTLREARAWLQTHACDVLLTDLGLPDGSGIDLIRECAVRHPGTDIMVISLFGDDQNVLAAIEAGADGYVLKDDDQPDVAQAILTLRAGGSPMSPLIARRLLRHVKLSAAPSVAAPVDALAAVPAPGGTAVLTQRELDVLNLIARGYTYQECARLLRVGMSTVQTHIKSMYRKLAVNSRTEAVFEARLLGLLSSLERPAP